MQTLVVLTFVHISVLATSLGEIETGIPRLEGVYKLRKFWSLLKSNIRGQVMVSAGFASLDVSDWSTDSLTDSTVVRNPLGDYGLDHNELWI